ncbi:MAG: HPr family phosphocarrier protein [Clostridiales bacterium]
MLEKSVIIKNTEGLHARLAAIFVQTASKFTSSIWVACEGKKVNAKSIMGIMSLAVSSGESIRIIADGEDESQSIDELVLLVESK